MSISHVPKKLVCSQCKKPISGAKTVIDEMWYCSDCTYLHDNPGKQLPPAVKTGKAKKQKETLFPVEGR